MKIHPVAYAKGKEDFTAGKTLAEVVTQVALYEEAESQLRERTYQSDSYVVGFLEGPLAMFRALAPAAAPVPHVRGG